MSMVERTQLMEQVREVLPFPINHHPSPITLTGGAW